MTPHQHLQALASEWADDYLLVARVGNETAVCLSDSQWARDILASGQVDEAISALAQSEADANRGEERRHHGAGLPGPAPEPPAPAGPPEAGT